MRFIFALLLLVCFHTSANATDYYFCPTGNDTTGDGSEGNPWATIGKLETTVKAWRSGTNDGDNAYLCRGGTFTTAAPIDLVHGSCSTTTRCTVGAYGTGALPNVHLTTVQTMVFWLRGSFGGIDFENLKITNDHGAVGFWIFDPTNNVHIRNNEFTDLSHGILLGSNASGDPDNLYVYDNHFHDLTAQAIGGGGDNVWFYDNTVERVAIGSGDGTSYHATYFYGEAPEQSQGIYVHNNTFDDTAPAVDGCHTVIHVAHGQIDTYSFKRNITTQPKNTSRPECWGLSLDHGYAEEESFTNIIVEDNEFHWVAGMGLGCTNCGNVTFQRNKFWVGKNMYDVIKVPSKVTEDAAYPSNNITASDNIIYIDFTGETPAALDAIDINVVTSTVNKNTIISNNSGNTCVRSVVGAAVNDNYCVEVTGSITDNPNARVNQ